jgi:hypothetical protein
LTLTCLGVYLLAANNFKVSVDQLKVKFYRVFNCIYSRTRGANSEIVSIELLEVYCLPFLLYASEAISLSASNVRRLDNCIDRAVCQIFGVNDRSNIHAIRSCVGLDTVKSLVEKRVEFYEQPY